MANYLERIGQQVGDYRLLRWLGGGGFGNVYLAQQIQNHSWVAIKLLSMQLNHSEELKAFINEARTMRLKHAHIVPLLDFGISREEIPFLVMEYAAQGTLRDRYPKGTQVPLPLMVNYVQQVASALQYAHEQHLIHRDVKPENMLLRVDGTVLLSDFGLVAGRHSPDSSSPHQRIGGTLPYMAPEQIQGQARAESDQYSLAVVVYEWITGHCPFEGTATEIAMQHAVKPPPSLVELVPGLARAVEKVVLKALVKDPRDRFVTVQDFAAALAQTVQEAPDTSSTFILQPSPPLAMPNMHKPPPLDDNKSVSLPCTSILSVPSSRRTSALRPLVDWGDALTVPVFYGREEEQALLFQWVVQERCRVVSVLGMGGIGKSALVMSVTQQLSRHFEVVIVRSLRDAPSCEALLDDCLQVLSPQPPSAGPTTLEQRISLLLSLLHKVRVLVVLDNLEGLLAAGDVRGHFRPGFEGYEQLLHQVAETSHQSCLLLTSREKPAELRPPGGRYSSVRSLRLAGLDVAACKQLLEEKGVDPGPTPGVGTEEDAERLIQVYAGNPLALKIVAETIVDLFGGKIGPFLAVGTVIFGSIADLLDQQFARLSALEQSVLYWLAIMREPVTLDELQTLLVTPQPSFQVLEAVDAGYRRSLIERGKRPGSFTLQPVVLEYVIVALIADTASEIQQHRLDKLIQYGLEQATAREPVRQTQERLLLVPLLAELQSPYPRRASVAAGTNPVEEQLLSLLSELREQADSAQGYGPANLIALLRVQRGGLSGLDLSLLSIRGAYLQSSQMHEVSLSGSLMRDTTFIEAINATWAVATSLDGKWWATSGMQGKVHLWDEGAQTPQRSWQAHSDMVQALAFSPDGRTLASGSLDGTIKLWDVEICSRAGTSQSAYGPHGALLWTAWQNSPQCLAFSPDSSLLASCGLDATVQLWDMGSYGACPRGTNLQTLTHPGPVYAVVWSPDGHFLASSCLDGKIRLWKRQKTSLVHKQATGRGTSHTGEASSPLQYGTPCPHASFVIALATGNEILSLQTSWVTSPAAHLAFAPDGRTLVSANWDRTITLWEIPNGRLLHTLPGQTDQTNRVTWSPDGCTLASCSYGKAIWLWDIEQGCRRVALHGHTAQVYSMAFTSDGKNLLSSSIDGSLRVWDVESYQCVRVIAGYALSLYDLAWSPDGMHLLSGGIDGLITIWDLGRGTLPRVLYGHSSAVSGVRWSPDGSFLVSYGWDAAMRLWDQTSHTAIQTFEDPCALLLGAAWGSDGHLLACGTSMQGIQVWDITVHRPCWVGQPYQTAFLHVVWSPDGTRLAGCGTDGKVYLWEGVDGTLLQCLMGHQGRVMSVEWSTDGRRLASGSSGRGSGELFVWDVQSGERVQTIERHPGTVYAMAWSRSQTGASGDLLISGGSDGKLRWWCVMTGECMSTQLAHQGTIRSLRVSPNGKWLASCGDDGAIMIWDLSSTEHLWTLRRDRPYERLNITGIRGLTETQKASLLALGAIEEATR